MNTVTDFRVPDVIGEILGYRAWNIEWCGRVPRLFSITAGGFGVDIGDTLWPTNRWFAASCPNGHGPGEIPDSSCSCGLYAAKSIEQLAGMQYGAYGSEGVAGKAVGEVAFAGKIVEGGQGWRAERGRISRLWLPLSKWADADPLHRAYGVPVGLLDWRKFGFYNLKEA